MHIKSNVDATNTTLGLFAIGFIAGSPFSYYDGTAKSP